MSITKNKFVPTETIKKFKDILIDPCNRNHLMMRLLIETGARRSEILSVKKNDLKEGQVTLIGLKGSNDRSIPLSEDLYKNLIEFCSSISTELLFPISTRQFGYIYRKLFGEEGMSSKAIRHSMGVELYQKSENVMLVKHVLGHKAISSTMVYVDYVDGQKGMSEHMGELWK